MTKRKTAPAKLTPASTENPSLLDRLLTQGTWIVLLPFILILPMDIEVVQRLGPPEHRIALAALFDPVYQTFIITLAITAAMIRTFPQNAFNTFRRLMDQEVMIGKVKGSIDSFGEIYDRWRKHPARYLLGLIFMGVGLAFTYYIVIDENFMRLLPGHQPVTVNGFAIEFWLSNLLVGIGVIINLFLVGCWIFELIVTAALINRAPKYFKLQFQPAHPDQ